MEVHKVWIEQLSAVIEIETENDIRPVQYLYSRSPIFSKWMRHRFFFQFQKLIN